MDETQAAALAARLERIEEKLDQVLAFRDQVIKIAASKAGKFLLGKVKTGDG
jgi:hypothetical protein